ncbi:hypothetical protein MP228_012277 [Amoeboaphelidium protococcarum]|nr:hypothetical protein MP228_012277 [Amoeboaphelidium protococcarum]
MKRLQVITQRRFINVRPISEIPSASKWKFQWSSDDVLLPLTTRDFSNILLVKKAGDDKATAAVAESISYIHKTFTDRYNFIADEDTAIQVSKRLDHVSSNIYVAKSNADYQKYTDFAITFGGDGTMLRYAGRFSDCASVPPVMSFSMGTLGFLLPFKIEDMTSVIDRVLQQKEYDRKQSVPVLMRSRVMADISYWSGRRSTVYALNEVSVNAEQGERQHVLQLDLSAQNKPFTSTRCDGVMACTPTGSTAYALSAGGPIVHPQIGNQSLCLVPFAPHSLSFRPLVLPNKMKIGINVALKSAVDCNVCCDGLRIGQMARQSNTHEKEDSIKSISIQMADQLCSVPCIWNADQNWLFDVQRLLGWNNGSLNE